MGKVKFLFIRKASTSNDLSARAQRALSKWVEKELQEKRIINIINAQTSTSDSGWVITITYDFKLIFKREIIVEKHIKIKDKYVAIMPNPINHDDGRINVRNAQMADLARARVYAERAERDAIRGAAQINIFDAL